MDNEEFQQVILDSMTRVVQELGELKVGQQKIDAKIANLELRIENDIWPTIKALGEGFAHHSGILKDHSARLERIERKVASHEFVIQRVK